MSKKVALDERVKRKQNIWAGLLGTWFILLVLAAGQAMIFSAYVGFGVMPIEYIFGMLGYWALVSLAFIAIIVWQKRRNFDRPIALLSDAARQVAKGDFAIRLAPAHEPEKYDQMDVLCEDFNRMAEALASTDSLKSDFIIDVSHELKTPLTVIANYATILKDDSLTPAERSEYAQEIATAASSLSTLVANILRLNKLENAGIVSQPEPYDITQQLQLVALAYVDTIDAANISLKVELEDKALVCADKEMLEIVWSNLLSNAIKFTPAGGSISLLQTSTPDSIIVQVQDSGCGMSAATQEHIFEKFYQADSSRAAAGNGLGLALVKRILELTSANIQVSSQPGCGSTFWVTFSKPD